MKTTFFNFLLAGLFISGIAFTGCSKSDAMRDLNNNPQQIAANANIAKANDNLTADEIEPNDAAILNHDLKITSAIDEGKDITQQFHFYTFRFAGKYASGEAQVWNDLLAQLGNWSMEVRGGDFGIYYPTEIFNELVFLNRIWTIKDSGASSFRLTASDGDSVEFTVVKL
jgi:hypothetical protein